MKKQGLIYIQFKVSEAWLSRNMSFFEQKLGHSEKSNSTNCQTSYHELNLLCDKEIMLQFQYNRFFHKLERPIRPEIQFQLRKFWKVPSGKKTFKPTNLVRRLEYPSTLMSRSNIKITRLLLSDERET